VAELLAKYPAQYKKAAMLPLLHLAQQQNDNWLPLAAMHEVARILEVPRMRVFEVATFYTMYNRRPVGKHLVQVCGTTPCELCGASRVMHAMLEEAGVEHVGDTSKDGLFTVVEVECAGACVNAPVAAINDDYYEDLTPETARVLIRKLRTGQPVTPGPQSGLRTSCEPAAGLTSLTTPPPGPGYKVRPDL